VPGRPSSILATLEAFGFEWDGPVLWQSQRGEAYAEALDWPCVVAGSGLSLRLLAQGDRRFGDAAGGRRRAGLSRHLS
jgi:hypothetical protein